MQQTETYKLNLIETSDPFSPAPLNENAQKLEAALGTKTDAAESGRQYAALAQRVTALEARKIVVGSYTGNATDRTINVGFTPVAVFFQRATADYQRAAESYLLTEDSTLTAGMSTRFPTLAIVDGGFYFYQDGNAIWNLSGVKYIFLALA